MIHDLRTQLCNNTLLPTDLSEAVVGDVLDVGGPFQTVPGHARLRIVVTEEMTTAGANGPTTIRLRTASAAANVLTGTVVLTLPTVTASGTPIPVGQVLFDAVLPGMNLLRYVGVTSATASEPLLGGRIDAHLTIDSPSWQAFNVGYDA